MRGFSGVDVIDERREEQPIISDVRRGREGFYMEICSPETCIQEE